MSCCCEAICYQMSPAGHPAGVYSFKRVNGAPVWFYPMDAAGQTIQVTDAALVALLQAAEPNAPIVECKTCSFEEVTIYSEEYFARSADGLIQSAARNSTITRTAQGRWTIAFSAPHPDGVDYHPSLTPEEQATTRDSVDAQIVQGTQTANGFDVMLTTGDNGGATDSYVNAPWSVGVGAPVKLVRAVS